MVHHSVIQITSQAMNGCHTLPFVCPHKPRQRILYVQVSHPQLSKRFQANDILGNAFQQLLKMEATFAGSQSLSSYAKLSKPPSSCSTSIRFSPTFFNPRTSLFAHHSAQDLGIRVLRLQCVRIKPCPQRNFAVFCSSEGGSAPNVAQGWLLEPVGDGDWKHIGSKVEKPGAYEIFSSEMIVGRVPEKADLVIPVGTVSGVHARIENKEGSLFVTDLDSTNGTYINEKRVPPGATTRVPPGSLLTFGDTHLAIFRVSKLEKVLKTETEAEPEPEPESEEKAGSEETAAPQPEAAS